MKIKGLRKSLIALGVASIISTSIIVPRIGTAERFRISRGQRISALVLYLRYFFNQENIYLKTDDGILAVFHSYEDGTLPEYPRGASYVVTCHPGKVKKTNPDLDVIGNWEGYTGTSFDPFTGILAIRPISFGWGNYKLY